MVWLMFRLLSSPTAIKVNVFVLCLSTFSVSSFVTQAKLVIFELSCTFFITIIIEILLNVCHILFCFLNLKIVEITSFVFGLSLTFQELNSRQHLVSKMMCHYYFVADGQQTHWCVVRQLQHQHNNTVETQQQRRACVQRVRPILQAAQCKQAHSISDIFQ